MIVLQILMFIGHCLIISIIFHCNCVFGDFIHDASFENHYLTIPYVYHSIDKREVFSTIDTTENKKHLDHLSIEIDIYDTRRILDLKLNKDLISKNYFEKHQEDGDYVIKKPQSTDEVELCHYNGDIRGVSGSWAALSTCQDAIRGTLYDGIEIYHIEAASNGSFTTSGNLSNLHIIYKHSDLKSNSTCGFRDIPTHSILPDVNHVEYIRTRRSVESSRVRGPYNADRLSRYIELVMTVDNKEYKYFEENKERVYQHCKSIVNIINSIYSPLNIFVALVGVEIWSDSDEIIVDEDGDKTLNNFLVYRREHLIRKHPNDNAQLLTRVKFQNGVVGKALKGSICTYKYSAGVSVDHSPTIGLVATTIAHEMGHNLGMEHDTTNCKCPRDTCIMSGSSSNSFSPTEWSSCSKEYLAVSFEHGMDYCLRNKPINLFDSPVCGNGFVEPGEECDCGLQSRCDNPCCNATSCTLYANATCATGKCCDLQTCKPITAGTECRSAEHECDLPEYCDGHSEYCPDDVFKIDGESCDNEKAFCYQGNCRNHNDQCRILWGPTGTNSNIQCYELNMKGDIAGNCGRNLLNETYTKCKKEDMLCGLLHCRHLNEKLEFGMESVADPRHTFITVNFTDILPCRTVMVDMGLDEVDPGLVPNGSKCGENKMCYNQKCLQIETLRAHLTPDACPHDCYGNGICNSKGHCHCNKGFAPPTCEDSGVGGSEDSGPAENPENHRFLWMFCFYMMLLVIIIVITLYSYSRFIRKSTSQFWKRDGRRTIQKSFQIHGSKCDTNGGIVNGTGRSLLSPCLKVCEPKDDTGSSIRDSLIGNFPGFSITPISNNTATLPLKPISPPSLHPVRPASTSIPVPTSNPWKSPPIPAGTSFPTRPAPIIDTRVHISSPVLDTTTSSTVKKLIDRNLPVRPAPPVPMPGTRSDRPNSTPDMLEEITAAGKESRKQFSEKSMTLGRLHKDKELTLPAKAAKIDKDTLKKLIISDPIPLNEPNIPVNPLPLSKDQEKCVIMRAHSLRYNANKQRSKIQSFGSMRMPNAHKSMSCGTTSRPTSPPPCPPPHVCSGDKASAVEMKQIPAIEGYYDTNEYDQTSDNIYAVIEEGPEDIKDDAGNSVARRPFIFSTNDGLLNEIVNEIQARNKYSLDSNQQIEDRNIDNVYENTADFKEKNKQNEVPERPLSSEYLKPITSEGASTLGQVQITKHVPLKIPDKSAPSYKPCNSFKKSDTQSINSLLNQSSSQKNSPTLSESKTSFGPSIPDPPAIKSSVAAVASRFNAINENFTPATIIKPKWITGNINKPEKSVTNVSDSVQKLSSVASIQKKFEAQTTNANKLSKFPPTNNK